MTFGGGTMTGSREARQDAGNGTAPCFREEDSKPCNVDDCEGIVFLLLFYCHQNHCTEMNTEPKLKLRILARAVHNGQ